MQVAVNTMSQKSLKEQLIENEELYETTGHRFGFKNLKIKENDPRTYESVWATLEQVCEDACTAAVNVAASAAIGEAHDAVWGIAMPTGEIVAVSTGIIGHFSLPERLIKWMINNDYDVEPGINDGDIFENNGPISSIHANDIFDVIPVFHEGELIAWTFGIGHTLDVGGITPGSLVMASRDLYTDGFITVGEKVGENDKLKKEYINRANTFTRMPFFFLLDTKARVAGCHMARDGILKLAERYGADAVKQLMKEFIEDSRRYASARVKSQTVPGRIRRRSAKDIICEGKKTISEDQARNFLMFSAMEMNIDRNAKVTWSFEGTNKWLPLGVNSGMAGIQAVATCVFCNVVGFEYHNSGSYGDLKIIDAPAGSFANPYPVNPAAAYGSPWAGIMGFMSMGYEAFSRAYYSRGFVEEVMAGTWHCPGIDVHGKNLSDLYVALVNVEMVPGGMGSRAIGDGEDYSWGCIYPNADSGTVEGLESVGPYVWLSRRLAVDGGGKGKYRGGLGLNSLYMIWPSADAGWLLTDTGITNRIPHNNTLYGAYPPPIIKQIVGHGDAVKKRIDAGKEVVFMREDPRKPGIERLGEGNYHHTEAPILFPEHLETYSLIEADHGGSAGFGDPLERDPALVKKDMDHDLTTAQTARDVWGVEVCYDELKHEWTVDQTKTNKLRKKLLKQRRARGIPFREWWAKSRQEVVKKAMIEPVRRMFNEAMELSPAYTTEFTEFWGLPEDFKL